MVMASTRPAAYWRSSLRRTTVPLAFLLMIAALQILPGCARSPLMDFTVETPPAVMVPLDVAEITDGRGRFREIFCAIQQDHGHLLPDDRPCAEALHRLQDEAQPSGNPVHFGNLRLPLRVVVVSGLFNDCVPDFVQPFSVARQHAESHGVRTDLIMVGGLSGIEQNAEQISQEFSELSLSLSPDERLVFVGHSKGAIDLLEAVVRYPQVAQRTAAIVGVAGVISGSPITNAVPGGTEAWAERFFSSDCPRGDGQAIEDLSRSRRLAWLAENELPRTVRYFSLGAFAERDDISFALRLFYDELAKIDPRNDGQVIYFDMLIPGSTLLGYANGDHWAVALPFNREHPKTSKTLVTRNAFPREVLLEAIVRFVEEDLLSRLDPPPPR
jgi:hypothetical protein